MCVKLDELDRQIRVDSDHEMFLSFKHVVQIHVRCTCYMYAVHVTYMYAVHVTYSRQSA